jgi:hypothetical protein
MDRVDWVALAERLARPVLEAGAAGRLESALEAECHPDSSPAARAGAPLEAMGRLLSGIGPWLSSGGAAGDGRSAGAPTGREAAVRESLADLTRRALAVQCDPDHPAYLRFRGAEQQTIVDAAFLAQGLLRCRTAVWDLLDPSTQARLLQAMADLRNRKPVFNNWLLFSAMTEAFLHATGAQPDLMRIDYAIRQHDRWYVGDGTYGDGPEFHFDYYNSFVIHPMLTDVLLVMRGVDGAWDEMWERRQRPRLVRAAEIQERMIAPDGSWPVVGRSVCYRCGAFQTLAQVALLGMLPASLPNGQVRAALSAAARRSLGAAGCWREDGFLRIGLSGHQPSLGERYITTGSLYLAACILLPLGLPAAHPFWTDPELPWTSVRVWHNCADVPADLALKPGG